MNWKQNISRREFLKLSSLTLGGLVLPKWSYFPTAEFPQADHLGRVTEEVANVRALPDTNSQVVGQVTEDTVLPWLREVIGATDNPYNQRWVETPQGYIWSPFLQRVKNQPNVPLSTLPTYGDEPGMWVEVTVPWVEVVLENYTAPAGFRVRYLLQNNRPLRFYYSQILWADQIKVDDQNQTWYHVYELYGNPGDYFWAPAEAFRPLTPDDVTPISPEVEDKRVEVDVTRQTLSCFEEGREVYFCRVSTGREDKETPLSLYLRIYWKLVSVHMAAGSAGAGYDLTGIGWPTFIASGGIAIHSTFWHNNYGTRTSAGCINCQPEDAKFVSRWTQPSVSYYPGEVDVAGTSIGTSIQVIES